MLTHITVIRLQTKNATGAGVNPLVKTLRGFEQDARGRVKTTQGLRAIGATRNVYVVGDNAAVEGTFCYVYVWNCVAVVHRSIDEAISK